MPTIFDVADYVRQQHPPPHFFIQNLLIKRGSLMVSGDPGVGKTWLLLHLAYCLSTGTPWFGFDIRQPTRVVYCNFDSSEPSIGSRVQYMYPVFNTADQMFYMATFATTRLEHEQSFNHFMEFIRPYQPQVVFLDCFRACFSGSENDPQQINPFVANMRTMQREFDASYVLSHHDNKNPLYSTPLSKVSGTTWLTGNVDTVIHLVTQPAGYQIQFGKHRESRIRRIGNINLQFGEDYNWVIRGRVQEV